MSPAAAEATATTPPPLETQLHALETELWELAFALERRGRADGADIARQLAERLGEALSSVIRK